MTSFFKTFLYTPLYNLFVFLVAIIPGHNLGIAIIALTALVRVILTPAKYKSLESQMKQRELQPEIKQIQEQYKNDRQAQSMATMQMYKDKGVNPASYQFYLYCFISFAELLSRITIYCIRL
jgi:YidC/Oxa1 family membrane protein insertase